MKLKIEKKIYDIYVAKKISTKLRGFMFIKDINYGMLYPEHNIVHTYFFKNKIDVVALDENNRVIYKMENVAKNKIIKVKNPKKNTSILELPKNTSKKIKIGEKLIFKGEDII